MNIYVFDHVPSRSQTMTWSTYYILASNKEAALTYLESLFRHDILKAHEYELIKVIDTSSTTEPSILVHSAY